MKMELSRGLPDLRGGILDALATIVQMPYGEDSSRSE
jgi:hypothetical protein